MLSFCPEEHLGGNSVGRNFAFKVIGLQATKSPFVLSEMRSMCQDARFAENWEEKLDIIYLVFALNRSGWCLQEFSLRVRKNKLEKLAGIKSAFKKLIGL